MLFRNLFLLFFLLIGVLVGLKVPPNQRQINRTLQVPIITTAPSTTINISFIPSEAPKQSLVSCNSDTPYKSELFGVSVTCPAGFTLTETKNMDPEFGERSVIVISKGGLQMTINQIKNTNLNAVVAILTNKASQKTESGKAYIREYANTKTELIEKNTILSNLSTLNIRVENKTYNHFKPSMFNSYPSLTAQLLFTFHEMFPDNYAASTNILIQKNDEVILIDYYLEDVEFFQKTLDSITFH